MITVTTVTTLVSALFAGIVLAIPGIAPQWEAIIISLIATAWSIVAVGWARNKLVSPLTAQKEPDKVATTGGSRRHVDVGEGLRINLGHLPRHRRRECLISS